MFREKLQAVFAPLWKSERVSPARIIIFGFLLLILLGAALLMLPFPHMSGVEPPLPTPFLRPPQPPV